MGEGYEGNKTWCETPTKNKKQKLNILAISKPTTSNAKLTTN